MGCRGRIEGAKCRRFGRGRRGWYQRGFSLVELLLAAFVLLVAGNAIVGSFLSATRLAASSRERLRAIQAAEAVVERLKSEPLAQVYVRHDADPENDPEGPGTAPGARFDVPGLRALPGDESGLAGRIEFPGDGLELREDALDPELGMPRDLNGDGAIDGIDHSTNYRLLPVRVVVEWRGVTGDTSVVLVTTLAGL